VITKPLQILRSELTDWIGEPEDGQTSSNEPKEYAIPEQLDQDMEIDENILEEEPELSSKSI